MANYLSQKHRPLAHEQVTLWQVKLFQIFKKQLATYNTAPKNDVAFSLTRQIYPWVNSLENQCELQPGSGLRADFSSKFS